MDHRTLADMLRRSPIGLDHPAAAMAHSSAHITAVLVTDNPTLEIMPVVTADSMAASVDMAQCTVDGSDRTAVIVVRSSDRITGASVMDNRISDTMPVDMAVSTGDSVGTVPCTDIAPDHMAHSADLSSALIVVGLSLVRETAIAARNPVLAT